MVNLLACKPNAGKPYAGRTGRAVYLKYAATVEQTQGSRDSKLLWGGDPESPRIGPSEPRCEVAGFGLAREHLKEARLARPGPLPDFDEPDGVEAHLLDEAQWDRL